MEQISNQHAAGRLTAHERLTVLLDENSFEDFSADAADADGSAVTGCGTIHGRRIFVFAKDHTVSSGLLSAPHAQQIVRLQARAIAASAPLIALFDSDGICLEEGLAALAGTGEIVRHFVQASDLIPQIAAIMGPCAGADAFLAQLADLRVMVSETSSLFVTGPDITNRLTGSELKPEMLGADFHSRSSGLADCVFADDVSALLQIRRLIDFLPSSREAQPPDWPSFDEPRRTEPALDTLVPDDLSMPYNVKELILKIVDEGDFFEIQDTFAPNIVTGFARFAGHPAGLIANQPSILGGVLDARAAQKAARFVSFCGRFHLPLVTFTDAPGFLPGLDQEENPIARHGAALLAAYASARVPKVTLVMGHAYGAAALMTGSKYMGADHVMAWPSASFGLMKADGFSLSASEALTQAAIDAVIEPPVTRAKIIEALSQCARNR